MQEELWYGFTGWSQNMKMLLIEASHLAPSEMLFLFFISALTTGSSRGGAAPFIPIPLRDPPPPHRQGRDPFLSPNRRRRT